MDDFIEDYSQYANTVLERCSSTNDFAKRLAETGFPHGTWVSAKAQEAGRGRLGRKWESLEGNLFISLISRIENKKIWSWVPLATAVGVVSHLTKIYSDLGLTQFKVKWPNDIWFENKKLGGILCESSGHGPNSFIVIGLGLNCRFSPQGVGQATSDLFTLSGGHFLPLDELRGGVLKAVLDQLSQLIENGPTVLSKAYEAIAVFPPGTEVQWGDGNFCGIVEGLGSSGELRVKLSSGTRMELFAEDVQVRRLYPPSPESIL